MEVGIRKGPEGTLLIYDHWGEYTLSKKPGGWYTPYTPQYTTVCTFLGAYLQSRGGDLLVRFKNPTFKPKFTDRFHRFFLWPPPVHFIAIVLVCTYSQPPPRGGGISGLNAVSRLVPNLSFDEMSGLPFCVDPAVWKPMFQHAVILSSHLKSGIARAIQCWVELAVFAAVWSV